MNGIRDLLQGQQTYQADDIRLGAGVANKRIKIALFIGGTENIITARQAGQQRKNFSSHRRRQRLGFIPGGDADADIKGIRGNGQLRAWR